MDLDDFSMSQFTILPAAKGPHSLPVGGDHQRVGTTTSHLSHIGQTCDHGGHMPGNKVAVSQSAVVALALEILKTCF